MGYSPPGTDFSSVGPHGVTSPARKTRSGMGSSLHGSAGPGRSPLLHGLSKGCSFPQGTFTCSGVESSTGCRVDICSGLVLHGLQGDNLLHHGLHHGLQGNLCSGGWSTSSPSILTGLSVCRVVSLTYSHSSLTGGVWHFLPFLKCITELPPALVSSGSILQPAGAGSFQHGGSFWHLLTEATPAAPGY